MSEENALIETGAIETPLGQIVTTDLVMQLAERLKGLITEDQKKKEGWVEEDYPMAVEICLSRGLLPQSIGYEFYLAKVFGKLQIMRKYSQFLNWAQGVESYRVVFQDLDPEKIEGYKEGDFGVRAYLIRRSQEASYQERYRSTLEALLAAGVDADTALEKADRHALKAFPYHDGMVKRDDVYGRSQQKEYIKKGGAGDLTGWKPGVTRAEIRAEVGVVRKVYGEPSAQETRQRNIQKYGVDLPQLASDLVGHEDEIEVEMVPEVREKYTRLIAQKAQMKRERAERDAGKEPEQLKYERQERLSDNPMRDGQSQEPIGEDWREALYEVEKENLAIWPDFEFKEEMKKYGYADDKALALAGTEIFGKNLPDITDLERLNWIEYGKRRVILSDKSLPLRERMDKVPELKELNEKTSIKKLGEHLRDLMLDCVRRETTLEVISL